MQLFEFHFKLTELIREKHLNLSVNQLCNPILLQDNIHQDL